MINSLTCIKIRLLTYDIVWWKELHIAWFTSDFRLCICIGNKRRHTIFSSFFLQYDKSLLRITIECNKGVHHVTIQTWTPFMKWSGSDNWQTLFFLLQHLYGVRPTFSRTKENWNTFAFHKHQIRQNWCCHSYAVVFLTIY